MKEEMRSSKEEGKEREILIMHKKDCGTPGKAISGADEEDGPEDVGGIIEGVELLSSLPFVRMGHAFWVDLLSTRAIRRNSRPLWSVAELGWQHAVPKGPQPYIKMLQ
ncbi:hypothetical protein KUCAC02_007052 [Chaenocephalus aceratus]|nr:hypothetical protein KUCAC02_007052 [Chaenocephalus aceratus]